MDAVGVEVVGCEGGKVVDRDEDPPTGDTVHLYMFFTVESLIRSISASWLYSQGCWKPLWYGPLS